MSKYAQHVISPRSTPQSEPIPGRTDQVENSAGGYSVAVDCWKRLDRFLILGNEGGSYYASERTLTRENATAVQQCADENISRTVGRIVEISTAGRAPKNDPAIFALSLLSSRGEALAALNQVCRTGTHLFQFIDAATKMRGWGRSLRRAVANWYAQHTPRNLAYQLTKYQQRNGWSHRDVMLKAHAKLDGDLSRVAGRAIGKDVVPDDAETSAYLAAVDELRACTDAKRAAALIVDQRLVRETVPTELLTKPEVWEALLQDMPLTAMIRNLATMTRIGLLAPMSSATGTVLSRLGDNDRLHKARIHPVAVLAAMLTYAAGRGVRGKNTWHPLAPIVDALDGAFYAAFDNVEPTGKRVLLALDVSGSMACGEIAGVPGLSPRVGSAAMAMVTARTEQQWHCVGFSGASWSGPWTCSTECLTDLSISPRQRLDDVCRAVSSVPMGPTDCALPMLYATERKLDLDLFVIYTDSETWCGNIHPTQALRQYRERMAIPAKLVVCGMVSSGFSIADPNDAGQLDIVGFDTNVPELLRDFAVNG